MVDEKIIEKIKKCLALAKSSNSNEAAIALRQAQTLMRTHGLTENCVELSDVKSVNAKAGWGNNPPKYLAMLVHLIKYAFGVDAVFHVKHSKTECVEYIGIGCNAELAAYAHDVLLRLLRRDRADYMKTLSRYKRDNKSRKADLFGEQWVVSARNNVLGFAQTEEQKTLIDRYLKNRHGDMEISIPREHEFNHRDNDARVAGMIAGKNVTIHQATEFRDRELLEYGLSV